MMVCMDCLDGYFFGIIGNTALCYLICPDRYFSNPNIDICQPCPYDCLTCDMTGNCLGCDSVNDKRKLFELTFRCLPIAGYYDNETARCVRCPQACSMCLNTTICSACISGYYLSTRCTCEPVCQPGSITILTTRVPSCQKCPYDC